MTARSLKHSLRQFEHTEFVQKQRMTQYAHWQLSIGIHASEQMHWSIGCIPLTECLSNVIVLQCKTSAEHPLTISMPLLSFNQILDGFKLPAIQLQESQDIIGISLDIVKSLVLEPLCNTAFIIENISIETEFDVTASSIQASDFVVESHIGQNNGKAQIFIQNWDLLSEHQIAPFHHNSLLNVSSQEHYIVAGAHLPIQKASQLKIDDVFMVFKLPSPQVLLPGHSLQSEVINMEQQDASELALYEMKVMVFGSRKTIQQLIYNEASEAPKQSQMAYIFLPDRIIVGQTFAHSEQHYFHVKGVMPHS